MTISVANEPLAGSLGGLAARSACAEGQRADGASEASALGSTQSYCFTTSANSENGRLATADAGERRRIRWGARAMLWPWQALGIRSV